MGSDPQTLFRHLDLFNRKWAEEKDLLEFVVLDPYTDEHVFVTEKDTDCLFVFVIDAAMISNLRIS